jgi:hypothetical protein
VANIFLVELARINETIRITQANIARDQALLAKDPGNEQLKTQIASGQNYLVDLDAQAAFFGAADSAPTASSGQVVAEEQRARSEDANVQNPNINPGTIPVIPASQVNQNIEFGTDGRIRTLTETQSTPPSGSSTPTLFATRDDEGNLLPPVASTNTSAGVGARNDDSPPSTSATTQQIINKSFSSPGNSKIVPKPNVLDQYASYTYSLSWYLLTPAQYNSMITSQKRSVSGWSLLMQSAGAPTQVAGAGVAGRNSFFNLDYYMDDLEINTLIPLKGTNMAHCAVDLKFKVVEPNGLTLINNLYRAVSNLYKTQNVATNPNYAMAQYCMVVRFYGYDDSGNLMQAGQGGTNGNNNRTDPRAVVEKFYPFVITNIKFRMANRAIEYDIEAKPIGQFYNLSQDRGTIPFAFGLIGETIGDVLIGKPVGTEYPASPGERAENAEPATTSPAPGPTSSVNDISASAGVDINGNFTGETASPFTVTGA